MNKLVIIINGIGGAGKDTLCEYIATHFKTINVSSITPIKEVAMKNGWNGEKNEVSRKFLADLKKVFTDFNNLPTEYLMTEYEKFIIGPAEIFFAHIREASEIDKFKQRVKAPCVTLLIRRNENKSWGNESDDDVENYKYDYYFNNDKELEKSQHEFLKLVKSAIGRACPL